MKIKMSRTWAMPNSNTFSIKPINKLLTRYLEDTKVIIDPFVRNSPFKKISISNDLSPEVEADYHIDAFDFLKKFKNNYADVILYDPPYSLRQVSECYKNIGIAVTMETTQSSWRSKHINEMSRIIKPNGLCISFGWNSSGIGKVRGFEIIEILLVAHGGSHNDTIVTVERKRNL